MDKIFDFNPTIYPIKIWIAVGASTQYLNSLFKNKVEDIPSYLHGKTTFETKIGNADECGILIRFDSKENMNAKMISHESAHAALKIFEKVGGKVSHDSDELFAHLIGYIAGCISDVKFAI